MRNLHRIFGPLLHRLNLRWRFFCGLLRIYELNKSYLLVLTILFSDRVILSTNSLHCYRVVQEKQIAIILWLFSTVLMSIQNRHSMFWTVWFGKIFHFMIVIPSVEDLCYNPIWMKMINLGSNPMLIHGFSKCYHLSPVILTVYILRLCLRLLETNLGWF